jgi:hypothetical protein
MYAIEFETELENGLIKVPTAYQTDLVGPVKVIILKETPLTTVGWPNEILAFQGISDIPPFESYRLF